MKNVIYTYLIIDFIEQGTVTLISDIMTTGGWVVRSSYKQIKKN